MSSLNPVNSQSVAHAPLVSGGSSSNVSPALPNLSGPMSPFRRVFQTEPHLIEDFTQFLKTIFFQLDENKVIEGMKKILEDPSKSDEEIYKELSQAIPAMKKRFAPLWQIWSLHVLKKGMGEQIAELTQNLEKKEFHDYLEVYFRRYLDVTRKIAKLPLDGRTIAFSDTADFGFGDRLQAGALLSSNPYKEHIPLNDAECQNPLEQPDLTHRPLCDEDLDDASLDMVSCLGGLHHVPEYRVGEFVGSLSQKLRPGGIFLLRDHNVTDISRSGSRENLEAIVSVVHSFVNAESGTPWEVESREVRAFRSLDEWSEMLALRHLVPLTDEKLVLDGDPTKNAMMAFVKAPQNLEELKQAIAYRSDGKRERVGTMGTWIEWGNVRYSQQYAEFVQDHHAYAFDFIGHIRQHWQYFYNYIKTACSEGISFKEFLTRDLDMNLFIVLVTTFQLAIGYATALPSRLVARVRFGANWRDVAHLTDLERFTAQVEKEYADNLVHTPFYMFDYIGKIKQLWQVVARSEESYMRRILNVVNAGLISAEYLVKSAVSAPVRMMWTTEDGFVEPTRVGVLIHDPVNELKNVQEAWKDDMLFEEGMEIKEIYTTPDGYKWISVPRYEPFTRICQLAQQQSKNLIFHEIGDQDKVSVDVLFDKETKTPEFQEQKPLFEMQKLQDKEGRHYATYLLPVKELMDFEFQMRENQVVYVHE